MTCFLGRKSTVVNSVHRGIGLAFYVHVAVDVLTLDAYAGTIE